MHQYTQDSGTTWHNLVICKSSNTACIALLCPEPAPNMIVQHNCNRISFILSLWGPFEFFLDNIYDFSKLVNTHLRKRYIFCYWEIILNIPDIRTHLVIPTSHTVTDLVLENGLRVLCLDLQATEGVCVSP